jgi:hypothetical protein
MIKFKASIRAFTQENSHKDVKLFFLIGLYLFKNTNSNFVFNVEYDINPAHYHHPQYSKKGVYYLSPSLRHNYTTSLVWHHFTSVVYNMLINDIGTKNKNIRIISFKTRHAGSYFHLKCVVGNSNIVAHVNWNRQDSFKRMSYLFDKLMSREKF